MNLQNVIIYLCISLFIIYYSFINYKKSDIILRVVLLLFFGYYSLNIIYFEDLDNYYTSVYDTFFFIFIGFPFIISVIISNFLKYDLLYIFTIIFLIQWIIFLNVNPCILKYGNKYSIMNEIPNEFKPKQEYLLSEINIENIKFPIIIKPIICSGNGVDIYIIKDKNEYFNILQKEKININKYMMQELLLDYNIEFRVLYEKYPWNKKGKIISIYKTIKNNFNKDNDIYWEDALKTRENMFHLSTFKLTKLLNNLINRIPNFNVGRFDILVKDLKDLNNLKFKIVELNGTMGMDFSISYSTSLNKEFLKEVKIDIEWYFRRLLIGLYNIITLKGYNPITLIIVMFISFRNMIMCNCWENIFSLYS
jgi:hypothetical protein